MNTPIVKQAIDAFKRSGYTLFDKGYYNLNIFGIRGKDRSAGKFDDLICVLYRDESNQWQLFTAPATADPGKHYLKNPLNEDGTAILLPQQCRGAFKLGIHGRSWASGGYEALEQVAPMLYIRDNDKNSTLDVIGRVFRANLKTNLHRASRWKIVGFVEKFSAGCQVVQSYRKFRELIELCKLSIKHGYENSFTYTLFKEEDFLKASSIN